MAMRIDLTSQGHFGQLFAHFRYFFLTSPAHLAIIAALRGGYKLVSARPALPRFCRVPPDMRLQQHASSITPYIHMWTNPSFKGLFVAQKLGDLQTPFHLPQPALRATLTLLSVHALLRRRRPRSVCAATTQHTARGFARSCPNKLMTPQ